MKAKANGMPDLHWIQCTKLDPVVSVNVSVATRTVVRVSNQIQNFWLDAATPLIILLEKAEELELPAEVINGIQTSLQLMESLGFHLCSTTMRLSLHSEKLHKIQQDAI